MKGLEMFCWYVLFFFVLFCFVLCLSCRNVLLVYFLCDNVSVFLQCSQTVTLNVSARPNRGLKIEKSIRAFLKQNQFVVRFLHTWLASISPHKRCESAAFCGAFMREVPHTAASIERLELYRVRRIKGTVQRKMKICHLLTLLIY